MTNLEENAKKMLLLSIVQKLIFCPVTKEVLDVRTCKYFVDSDGWPAYVMSPEAYDAAVSGSAIVLALADKGLYPMPEGDKV